MRGHRGLDTVLGMQRECGMKERQSRVNFSRLALVGKLEAFSVCGFGIDRWHSRLFVDACILGIMQNYHCLMHVCFFVVVDMIRVGQSSGLLGEKVRSPKE